MLYVMIMGRYPFTSSERKMDFQFRGGREIDELVRGLIRIRPEERMTLQQCLQSSWLTTQRSGTAVPSAGYAAHRELRWRLPHKPEDVASLQADLSAYARKHRAAVRFEVLLGVREVHILATELPRDSLRPEIHFASGGVVFSL